MTRRTVRTGHLRFWMLVLVLAGIDGTVFGQALPPQPFDFSFDAVTGAGGYLVEVRDVTGNVVLSRNLNSEQTSVSLKLIPGAYSLRLTTLNRLLHAESSSDWLPIEVKALVAPRLVSMDAQTVTTWSEQEILLKASNLAQDCTVSVQPADGPAVAAKDVRQLADGTLRVTLPPLDKVGDYTVILTNPPNLSIRIRDQLKVHYAAPTITEILPDALDASDPSRDIVVSGSDFSPEALVTLQPPSKPGASKTPNPVPVRATVLGANGLRVRIPADLETGRWNVLIANGPGEEPVKAGVLAVTAKVADAKKAMTFWGWTGLSAGAASSGVALVTGILGYNAHSHYESATTAGEATNYRTATVNLANVFVPTLVGGAVLLGTGVVLLMLGGN